MLRNKLDFGPLSMSQHLLVVQQGIHRTSPNRVALTVLTEALEPGGSPGQGGFMPCHYPALHLTSPLSCGVKMRDRTGIFPVSEPSQQHIEPKHSVPPGLRGVTSDVHAEDPVLHIRHGHIQLLVGRERDQVPVFIWVGQRTPSGARPTEQRDTAPPGPPHLPAKGLPAAPTRGGSPPPRSPL